MVIPGTHNNKPVTNIGNGNSSGGFWDCKGITNVVISDNAAVIGASAFSYSGVTSVVIPASVTKIGSGAFANCNKLASVTFYGGSVAMDAKSNAVFPGDLVIAYQAGGAGTYTRRAGGVNWTKQGGAPYSQPEPAPAPPTPADYGPPPQQPSGKAIGGYDEPERSNLGGRTLSDSRDGKTYRTARVGGSVWMAENLNYASKTSKCYENNNSFCAKYGRLYNWVDARTAVCPAGWHLPSRAEWNDLINSAGGLSAGAALKSRNGWSDRNGRDNFGFAALAGGYWGYASNHWSYNQIDNRGIWWTSGDGGGGKAYYRVVSSAHDSVSELSGAKDWYYSVRCVMDN